MTIDTISVAGSLRNRSSFRVVLHRSWLVCHAWLMKRRTRHALLEMTEDQLRDIGISRSEAQREVRKSFYWD